jgi:threonine synthase
VKSGDNAANCFDGVCRIPGLALLHNLKRQTMRYISTRGGMPPKSFSEILLSGLSPDGGLAIPEAYPQITATELAAWRGLSYPALAFEILSRFVDDIPADDLRNIINQTYTAEVFGTPEITPLKTLEPGLHILGLSNGPTLAFKDIAMQLLGNLFQYQLNKTGDELNILGATSGDTGSSAEYAMRGKRGIRVFMLSPLGKMSRFQTAQMFSLQDKNIFNIAIRGVFDDCQDIVKAVSNDHAFKQAHRIGTVNSINWARIVAQVVYYFKGYFAATKNNNEQVSFAVPSGNFGNICAGHVARMMGLPVKHLILATNENDVLDEFFRTGVYRPRTTTETQHTSSPSMDISKASNFERFIFDLTGRNAQQVKELWSAVDQGKPFDLSQTPLFAKIKDYGFISGSSNHAARISTIRDIHQRYRVLVDTHTADGLRVGQAHRETGVPLICLETALPAKFAESIQEAIGREPERPAGFENLEDLPQRFVVKDADVAAVKDYIDEQV